MSPKSNNTCDHSGSLKVRHSFLAYSLAEVLVAAFLSLLLLTLIAAFLVPVLRHTASSTTGVEIQQECLRALSDICYSLEMSSVRGVSFSCTRQMPETGPVYLAVIPVKDVDGQGVKLWEERIVLYVWEGPKHKLIRKEWGLSSPPALSVVPTAKTPMRISVSDMEKISAEPSLRTTVLAKDVAELRIEGKGTELLLASPVTVTIRIQRKAATGKKSEEVFELSRRVPMKN